MYNVIDEIIVNSIDHIQRTKDIKGKNKCDTIKLNFDMYRNDKYDSSEDNWFITIVYNYTPEEWMEFVTIGFNYNQVCDKLFGFGFGLESVKMYQEEYGNLKFLAQ